MKEVFLWFYIYSFGDSSTACFINRTTKDPESLETKLQQEVL